MEIKPQLSFEGFEVWHSTSPASTVTKYCTSPSTSSVPANPSNSEVLNPLDLLVIHRNFQALPFPVPESDSLSLSSASTKPTHTVPVGLRRSTRGFSSTISSSPDSYQKLNLNSRNTSQRFWTRRAATCRPYCQCLPYVKTFGHVWG